MTLTHKSVKMKSAPPVIGHLCDIRDYGIWRQNFGHTAAGAPPVPAAVRPLLGAPPVPVVRPLRLARQPTPADTPAGFSLEAAPWLWRALAHIGPVRPWEIAAALGITFPHEILLSVGR
jgi:hypothetical protein